MTTTAGPFRKRQRMVTPEAATLEAAMEEIRRLKEESQRQQELLQQREADLRVLQQQASSNQISRSHVETREESRRESGDGVRVVGEREGEREGLGYKLKPDTYDGSGSLREFLAQFILIARANKWTEENKTIALASSLRGTARSILDGLEDGFTYQELTAKLELRYGEYNNFQNYYVQFTNRKIKVGEEFADYGSELERLARHAYPECAFEIRDRMACAQFIAGLKEGFVRRTLQLENISSLKIAIEREKVIRIISEQNFDE